MEFRKFDYIDRGHSSQYDFIRIPKAMMDNDGFLGTLSIQAKLLYGLLLDRMAVSMKNHWLVNRTGHISYTQSKRLQRIYLYLRERPVIICQS